MNLKNTKEKTVGPLMSSELGVMRSESGKKIIPAKAQRRQGDGPTPASRTDVRDLRKISPVGRNDKAFPFASLAGGRRFRRSVFSHKARRGTPRPENLFVNFCFSRFLKLSAFAPYREKKPSFSKNRNSNADY